VKEDVLEQVVDDYLQFKGYFTIHNVRLRLRRDRPEHVRQDPVASNSTSSATTRISRRCPERLRRRSEPGLSRR